MREMPLKGQGGAARRLGRGLDRVPVPGDAYEVSSASRER